MKKTRPTGFTLIELIIVMGILGILSTVVISRLVGNKERARDARRKEDIRTIQQALEQYSSLCGLNYPAVGGGNTVPTSISCASPATTFLNPSPKDPKTGASYSYTLSGGGTGYTLCATLEKEVPSAYCANNQQ